MSLFDDQAKRVADTLFDEIGYAMWDVQQEIANAVEKHGLTNTPLNPLKDPKDSFIILAEEFGEVARALTDDEGSPENLEVELLQTAAMAIAMVVGVRIRSVVPSLG